MNMKEVRAIVRPSRVPRVLDASRAIWNCHRSRGWSMGALAPPSEAVAPGDAPVLALVVASPPRSLVGVGCGSILGRAIP